MGASKKPKSIVISCTVSIAICVTFVVCIKSDSFLLKTRPLFPITECRAKILLPEKRPRFMEVFALHVSARSDPY